MPLNVTILELGCVGVGLLAMVGLARGTFAAVALDESDLEVAPLQSLALLLLESAAATVASWYLCLFADVFLHNLGHIRFPKWLPENKMFAIHMKHHKQSYPCGKLLQQGPYKGEGGEVAFMPPVCAIWLSVFYFVSFRPAMLMFCLSFTFLLISNYLHEEYHVQDSWLEQWLGEWFLSRRRFHFHHHHRLRDNMSLGGISSLPDRLFRSYWADKDRAKAAHLR